MPGWVFGAIVVVLILVAVGWLLLDESFKRVASGRIGLLVIKGRATDRTLLPGPHFVPALRRHTIETYPSLELSYRAGDPGPSEGSADVEHQGPPVRATLGDRIAATVAYTVRFRIEPAQLRSVHERFGPDGIWPAVHDESARTVRRVLADPDSDVDHLFGAGRAELEARLGDAVTAALAADGFVVTAFALGDTDLGRTGQVVQAIARARLELDREEAEAATRVARARHDAELEEHLGRSSVDAALRYREVDAWRDVVGALGDRGTMLRGPVRTAASLDTTTTDEAAQGAGSAALDEA